MNSGQYARRKLELAHPNSSQVALGPSNSCINGIFGLEAHRGTWLDVRCGFLRQTKLLTGLEPCPVAFCTSKKPLQTSETLEKATENLEKVARNRRKHVVKLAFDLLRLLRVAPRA